MPSNKPSDVVELKTVLNPTANGGEQTSITTKFADRLLTVRVDGQCYGQFNVLIEQTIDNPDTLLRLAEQMKHIALHARGYFLDHP